MKKTSNRRQDDGIMVEESDIRFTSSFADISTTQNLPTIKHIYCLSGTMAFMLAGRRYRMKAPEGLLLMANQQLEHVEQSDDFQMSAALFSERIMRMVLPATQYGTQMLLAQMQDPVLHMSLAERDLALAVMSAIRERFHMRDHLFYYDVLKRTVQTAILDHYDIFARRHKDGMRHLGQVTKTFHRFITMLDEGLFRKDREVGNYARALYITPKYLSELSVKVSGRPASYWIDFFTTVDIASLMQDGSLTIRDISERLNFTSLAYFSHYFKAHFGISPQAYRRHIIANQ